MFPKIKSKSEINIIRTKILVKAATQKEIQDFYKYVMVLEGLVEKASNENFYGNEGWEHHIGWN